jgi:hypothetical protein
LQDFVPRTAANEGGTVDTADEIVASAHDRRFMGVRIDLVV